MSKTTQGYIALRGIKPGDELKAPGSPKIIQKSRVLLQKSEFHERASVMVDSMHSDCRLDDTLAQVYVNSS